MKFEIDNYEYNNIVSNILTNKEFQKIEECKHHNTNRLDHSKRVSIHAYKICKKLHLDYVSAARAGLLHDFFTNKYSDEKKSELMKNHPSIAVKNAKKYFKLNDKEINIIESHMFPVNLNTKPNYPESFIVGLVDKGACLYENMRGLLNILNYKVNKEALYLLLYLFN
ncbi:MAG: HD domain-containing protein [Bacilli bacterium]